VAETAWHHNAGILLQPGRIVVSLIANDEVFP
jgi:hypothetical protein